MKEHPYVLHSESQLAGIRKHQLASITRKTFFLVGVNNSLLFASTNERNACFSSSSQCMQRSPTDAQESPARSSL
uniref:Uncharacterized protein n=1 Tax=Zea mays TaxID=4577 RepID=C4IYR5_MAIZE|nr:unknown [Zea mays]